MAYKQTFTRFNVISVLFASFGSLYCGYTLAVIISTLGQPTFYSSLGLVTDTSDSGYGFTNAIISTANGIFFAGAFFGALLAGGLSSRLGRIRIFQMSSIVGIIGGAIQTGAISPAMYLVARLITGFGMGLSFAVVPVWVSEVAPPKFRGLMAVDTSFGWRFPNAIIIVWAVLLLAGTFIIPESPRWLVTKERDGEALEVLRRLHHDPSDPQDTFAHQELLLIRNQISDDNKQRNDGGKWQIIAQKTYRRRLIVALMTTIGSQNTGILVINNFNALLYASLGLNNWQALLLSAGYNTWAMIANFLGAVISDRFGRRKLLCKPLKPPM
ncbi:hypothetical protein LTR84_001647 [Exophiala bonariae]|uniref:Major facilitator superfamily (MFS) profile domain-containing protein n=1 Tax=Exophiala bonariae TaxID=1690606 RepID=A0AAV9NB10_9EURO|nr:hypothetical protein LTR84_001647 [Exophiala bonariae]